MDFREGVPGESELACMASPRIDTAFRRRAFAGNGGGANARRAQKSAVHCTSASYTPLQMSMVGAPVTKHIQVSPAFCFCSGELP